MPHSAVQEPNYLDLEASVLALEAEHTRQSSEIISLTRERRDRAQWRVPLPPPIGDFHGHSIVESSGLLTSWANLASGMSGFTPDSGLASKVETDAEGRKYLTAPAGLAHVASATLSAAITERTYLVAYADDYDSAQRNLLRHNTAESLNGHAFIVYQGQFHSQWYSSPTFVNEAAPLTGGVEIYAVAARNAERILLNTGDSLTSRYSLAGITLAADSNVVLGWSNDNAFRGKLYGLRLFDRALDAASLSQAVQDFADALGLRRPRARVKWGKTSDAPWPARDSAGCVTHNGELYVLAGYTIGGLFNDVWKRSVGGTWSEVTAAADFPARNLIGAASHVGKIWITNGFIAGLTTKNDVWSSATGAAWTNNVSTGPWTARAAAKMIVHNGELIFAGGFTNVNGGVANDVWASSNGVSWTQRCASASWAGRGSHGFLSFAGKLWLMAGGVYNTAYQSNIQADFNDVWASDDDGATWTRQPDLPIPPCRFMSSVVHGGYMWLIGGYHHQNLSHVLRSFDGQSWEIINPSFVRRHEALVASFDNKLWVMGGVCGSNNAFMRDSYGDAWPTFNTVGNDQHCLEMI